VPCGDTVCFEVVAMLKMTSGRARCRNKEMSEVMVDSRWWRMYICHRILFLFGDAPSKREQHM